MNLNNQKWKEIKKDVGDLFERNIFHKRFLEEMIIWLKDKNITREEITSRINYVLEQNETGAKDGN